MKKTHEEIIEYLSEYLKNNPEQRFGQALFNLGITEFINPTNPAEGNYGLRDIYNDSDEVLLQRIKKAENR